MARGKVFTTLYYIGLENVWYLLNGPVLTAYLINQLKIFFSLSDCEFAQNKFVIRVFGFIGLGQPSHLDMSDLIYFSSFTDSYKKVMQCNTRVHSSCFRIKSILYYLCRSGTRIRPIIQSSPFFGEPRMSFCF